MEAAARFAQGAGKVPTVIRPVVSGRGRTGADCRLSAPDPTDPEPLRKNVPRP